MPKYIAGKPQAAREQKFLPEGDYFYRVMNAVDKKSRQGNEMIELKMECGPKGATPEETVIVYDYLVFDGKSEWKIDSFLKASGEHPGEGEDTEINGPDLIDYKGEVRLGIDEYQGKKKNVVAAYLWADVDDFSDGPPGPRSPDREPEPRTDGQPF